MYIYTHKHKYRVPNKQHGRNTWEQVFLGTTTWKKYLGGEESVTIASHLTSISPRHTVRTQFNRKKYLNRYKARSTIITALIDQEKNNVYMDYKNYYITLFSKYFLYSALNLPTRGSPLITLYNMKIGEIFSSRNGIFLYI